MKNHVKNSYVLLCSLVCLLTTNLAKSQQTLTQINGWNAYVHLPASYSSTSATYPTIIFFPGLGEIGTNPSRVIENGPGAYITQGWNGNVVVDGSTVEFIVISLQPPTAYPNEIAVDQKIQTIKSLYRVNNNKLYLTGLSHGGWCSTTFVTGDAYGGPYKYASQIAAVVEVQGVVPDDNAPYPNLFDNYALSGGKLLGFEQALDNRGMPTRINRMNATRSGSGIYVQTNFGGGGHCCWNQFYGGQGTQPGNFMLGGVNQNLYQWLARQTLGTMINQAPIANAGTDKVITLPTTSTTLNGSGTDADGTITAYLWTKTAGPSAGTITNSTSAQANISALTQGVYQYQLKVTDNSGNTSTDLMQVTVNGTANTLPTSNAGPDQTKTLPTNTASLNGSGTDADGTIASYQWTKVSGPSGGTISNAATAGTTVSELTQGTYSFQLKVTDNAGATATDNINVNVNAATSSIVCNTNAPVTHTITQTAPGEIYRPNGSLWKGGDTLKITGTNYSVIEFNNVGGDACRPLVIMPMTTLTTPVFRFKGNCRYIKLWGGKTPYGIKINAGPLAISSSHHIEADNIEISGGSTGVYCKQDVVYADTMTWNPNYRMTKFTFKNLWIHDINGEGMYVGITQPSGLAVRSTYSGLDTLIVPVRLDSVEISNCIVERCTWDAIQLSNARNGNKIFNNTVRNYGTLNISSQQAGIILGGNTNGDIYDNTIIQGTGNGIEAFGYGVINIYNNTMDSCGYDGIINTNGTEGQQSIYASDYVTGIEVNPKQTINVYGNTIKHPKSSGAIFLTGYFNNSNPSSVYNNTFCIPNAAGNWQTTYLKLLVAGSTNTNNSLSCVVTPSNTAPTANAGLDANITLPTNSSTLNGTGTDPDGTIASYAWAKISGPAASTLTNANTANATAASLVEGVYSYQLTVTDNAGAIGRDTVNVNVNVATLTLLPAVNPANTVNGIDYKYYEGNWSVLPDFASLNPVKTGFTNNFNISLANKTTQFGFSFTGYINVPADGQYKFYTSSDDGSKLYIDSVLTVSNDGLHGTVEKSGLIGLKAGKHVITGLFFQQGGGKVFIVSYEGMGITKQAIPSSSLYRVNATPVSNAGANKTLTLPDNSTLLSGSGADTDGTIASYAWAKISGPATGTLTNAATANATAASLVLGVYSYQLTVTDNAGATGRDTVNITVITAANQAPIANAGNNQTVILPTNIAALNGTGTDTDGTIISYQWTKISGTGGTISNASTAITSVTGLVEGTYQYQLKITDNSGATASAIIQITVSSVAKKIIRVNIYGGTNPYTNPKWNNWNNNAGLTSNKFSYEDLSISNVSVSSNSSGLIKDNGTNYASTSTVCPPEVLRYNSYNTSFNTLTFNGLNPAKKYSFEFYASRANSAGNSTVFQIINNLDTISTNNNINDYARFFNISPDNAGRVTVTISRIGTWHYLAGFSIIEEDNATVSAAATPSPAKQIYQGETLVEMGADAVSVYPNPFAGSFKVQLSNKTAGAFVLKLSATSGQTVFYKKINKASGSVVETINVNNLTPGTYILEIISVATGNKTVHKVIKN